MRLLTLLLFLLTLTGSQAIFGLFFGLAHMMRNHRYNQYVPDTYSQQYQPTDEYDFVIVGSGSAGTVIANRLSENPQWKILLLEAGNQADELSLIPLFAPVMQLSPHNWGYNMEKDPTVCTAMEGGVCSWPRGKGLGGTSIINYMIYTRGNPEDYQKWEALGNPGWNYESVIPYYLKSEDCHLGKRCRSKYHHQDGYISLETSYTSQIAQSFLQGGKQIGYRTLDYNTPDFMGFSKIQATMKHGRRHSVASAFLDPIASRTNLQVTTSARVTKLLINPSTKSAFGVEYYKDNRKYMVRVRKEVIVSAGAFHSPQLLMLSGVGPENHLRQLGIPVVQNLPVGQTMYDHVSFLGSIYTTNETTSSLYDILNTTMVTQWQQTGKGFLSSLGGIEALAYVNTDPSKKPTYPDVELILASVGSLAFDYGLVVRKTHRIRQDFYDSYFLPLEKTPHFSIMPMMLHPKSRGYLKLRSTNPFDPPMLFGNYFSDEGKQDLKTMISSIRFIQKLSKTPAFQKIRAQRYEKSVPGCEGLEFDSDSYWECAIRALAVTLHHQTGTCRMGPRQDPEAVVDHRLTVHGIKNLRVADTSIIPVTLSAHTNAPSIMIGEKLSDIIKEDWVEAKKS